MDMLNLVRKHKLLFLIFIILFYSSCRKESQNDYMIFSENYIGKIEYANIHKSILDTIYNWKINSVGYRSIWALNYKLDSILCFNKEKNRLVTAFLVQCNDIGCIQDDIHFFYGVKIKNKWFFFKGADLVLAREFYQKNIHQPLSFDKLHEIALEEIFSGYLFKKDKGFWNNIFSKNEYEINDAFFTGMESYNSTSKSYGSCQGCKTFEQSVIYLINYQWKKPDKDGYIKYDHPTPEEMTR